MSAVAIDPPRTAESDRDALLRLRAAMARLQKAQSVSRTGSWDYDVGTGAIEWSEEFYRLVGLSVREEPPGLEEQETLFAPHSWAAVMEAFERAIETGEAYELQVELVGANGGARWAIARGEGEFGPDGTVERVFGTLQDVTDLEVARRARDLANARASLAAIAGGVGVWEWDIQGESLTWDDRMYELYGVDPEVVPVFETWRDALHPDDMEAATELIGKAVEGSAEFDTTFRIVPGGRVRHIRAAAIVLRDPDGAARAMVGTNWDVTEQVEATERLARTARELERSNQDLQQFAYAASHDLQEPLRAVSGCTQILAEELDGTLAPETSELLGHIVDGAARMKTLITDLLAYSRVGTEDREYAPTDPEEALQEAERNLEEAVSESGAIIGRSVLPPVRADRRQLIQLFQNLIGNGIKYAGDTVPEIQVHGTVRADGMAEIVVRDHGIGIPEAAREKVFEIFQRLHTRDRYPGTGIGLALCRRIVEGHGGSIWIADPDGPGVEVRFSLPTPDHAGP